MVEFRGGKEKEKWDYFISKNKNVLIVLHSKSRARACVCARVCVFEGMCTQWHTCGRSED